MTESIGQLSLQQGQREDEDADGEEEEEERKPELVEYSTAGPSEPMEIEEGVEGLKLEELTLEEEKGDKKGKKEDGDGDWDWTMG